jgi:F5/8 type C domain-containing protein
MRRNVFYLFAILLVLTFSIIATNTLAGEPIPNGNWTCVADSEEPGRECEYAIDGNPSTKWHTLWSSSDPPHPHWFEIDLGNEYSVCGFRYLPRQDNYLNGTIGEYRFYVSDDGTDWGRPVAQDAFAACDHGLKEVSAP